MTKIVLDMAISVDGFIAGPNDEDGGLHNYYFSPAAATAEVVEKGVKDTGVIIMGRHAYDIGAQYNGFADNPYQVPTFVLSHDEPAERAKGAEEFIFSDDLQKVVEDAKKAAGDRDVVIGGGAETAQEFLKAGLVDQVQLHVVPVILGEGKRLFEGLGSQNITLENLGTVDAPDAIHLHYRVVKK